MNVAEICKKSFKQWFQVESQRSFLKLETVVTTVIKYLQAIQFYQCEDKTDVSLFCAQLHETLPYTEIAFLLM